MFLFKEYLWDRGMYIFAAKLLVDSTAKFTMIP